MSTSETIPSADAELERKHLRYLLHDVNNNLGTICLTLEEIKIKLGTHPDCADDVQALQAAQQTIYRTTHAMRELLRREQHASAGSEPAPEVVDLRNLVSEVVGQFATEAKRKGVELALEVPSDATVESSYHLIGLILQNLVDNAVKYSHGGTVRVKAQQRLERAERHWLVSVSDEGPGIPQDRLLKLFSALEHESKPGPLGFGIGMGIMSDAAKQLGAQLRATSRVGFGSVFYLLLPSQGREVAL